MEEKPIIENKIKVLELELDNVKKRIDRLESTKQKVTRHIVTK